MKADDREILESVGRATAGVPHMSPEQGCRIFEHVCVAAPERVLEIGTAHGVGTAYLAAALEVNGGGSVVTLDHSSAPYCDPTPDELLAMLGLRHRVELCRDPSSSYTWWLRALIKERSDAHGNCEPLYDFIFLDGAHNWTIDGLAVVLCERLLKPGGWLLLDDLEWTYAGYDMSVGLSEVSEKEHSLSLDERRTPHIREVFELLVKPHPNLARFREENTEWGWAQKVHGPRELQLVSTASVKAAAMRRLTLVRNAARTATNRRRSRRLNSV